MFEVPRCIDERHSLFTSSVCLSSIVECSVGSFEVFEGSFEVLNGLPLQGELSWLCHQSVLSSRSLASVKQRLDHNLLGSLLMLDVLVDLVRVLLDRFLFDLVWLRGFLLLVISFSHLGLPFFILGLFFSFFQGFFNHSL